MTTSTAFFNINRYPIAMVCMAFILTACGGDTVNVDTPTYLKSLTVIADAPTPTLIGPGDYAMQFHATANYSDGTKKDASGLSTWISSNDSLITIDKNGLAAFNIGIFKDNSITIWATFTTAFDSVILTISPPAPGAPAGSFKWDITANVPA